MWWHTTVGEHILSTGRWPTADFYSFTAPGRDWVVFQWLGEVVMALAMRLGNLQGQFVLLLGMAATLVVLLYYSACLRSGNSKAAFVATVLLLPVLGLFFSLRPQLLGFIFLVLTLICLEHFRRGRRRALWWLPPFFLVWVNTHGSFTVGLLAVGFYWLGGVAGFRLGALVAEPWGAEQRRQLLVVLLFCVLVLPLTPYGTRLAAYPLEFSLFHPVLLSSIGEWGPPLFQSPLWKLFLLLALVFFVAQWLLGLTWRLEEAGLLLFACYAACVHRRFAIIFLAVFVPLLASLLARWLPAYQPEKDRYVLNLVLLLLIGAAVLRWLPSREELDRRVARVFPVGAAAYLHQHPVAGRMFNDSDWGGYLIWSFGPAHKVFIDGRVDMYEAGDIWSDYLHISLLKRDTRFLLRKYGIEACLVEPDTPLSTFLTALPDWERVYSDDVAVVYVHKRRQPASPPLGN